MADGFEGAFWRRMPSTGADAIVVGYCAGILADGVLDSKEINGLHTLMTHVGVKAITARTLVDALEGRREGRMSDEELAEVLHSVAGGDLAEGEPLQTGAFCFDETPPTINLRGRFVLTGEFTSGTRRECEGKIKALGGKTARSVSEDTDYVVVGEYASSAYKHGSYGRKVEKAVRLREKHGRPAIVAEAEWLRQLEDGG